MSSIIRKIQQSLDRSECVVQNREPSFLRRDDNILISSCVSRLSRGTWSKKLYLFGDLMLCSLACFTERNMSHLKITKLISDCDWNWRQFFLKQVQSFFRHGVNFSAICCYSTGGAQAYVVMDYKEVLHKVRKQWMLSLGEIFNLAMLTFFLFVILTIHRKILLDLHICTLLSILTHTSHTLLLWNMNPACDWRKALIFYVKQW